VLTTRKQAQGKRPRKNAMVESWKDGNSEHHFKLQSENCKSQIENGDCHSLGLVSGKTCFSRLGVEDYVLRGQITDVCQAVSLRSVPYFQPYELSHLIEIQIHPFFYLHGPSNVPFLQTDVKGVDIPVLFNLHSGSSGLMPRAEASRIHHGCLSRTI